MIILIHVLYICSEYLWSFFVNRNEVPVLEEPVQNNTDSVNVLKSDVNATHSSIKPSSRFLNCSAGEYSSSENEVTEENDNLQKDEYGEYEKAFYDFNTKKIRFYPPVYIQRYVKVINILQDKRWKGHIKKVIDIGCSEFGFFKFLKNVDGVEEIIEIDIDKNVLKEFSYRIHPWLSDYLHERKLPLEVTILCGNVAHLDHRLEGADAVIAIELIEHLYPSDLEDLPFNVFGIIKPRVAIFTTPNEDFNILFDNFSGFRHDDHKFEWSREQFQSWARNICKRFPDYEVKFVGIGPGPIGKEDLGCCSQAAVFVKIHFELPEERSFLKTFTDFVEYELIDHVEYPFNSDARTDEWVTRDDAINFIHSAARSGDYFNGSVNEIPLANILLRVYKTCDSLEKLRKILEDSNYEIKENEEGDSFVIIPEENECDSEEENDQFLTESLNDSEQYVVHDNDVVTDDWDNVEKDPEPWNGIDGSELSEFKSHNVISDGTTPKEVVTALDNNLGDHVYGYQLIFKNKNTSDNGDKDSFKNSCESLYLSSSIISNDKNFMLGKNAGENVSLNSQKNLNGSNLSSIKELKLDKSGNSCGCEDDSLNLKDSDSSVSFPLLHNSKNFMSFNDCIAYNQTKSADNYIDYNKLDEVDEISNEMEMSNSSLNIKYDDSCHDVNSDELSYKIEENLICPLSESNDSSKKLNFNNLTKGDFGFVTLPLDNKCKIPDKCNEVIEEEISSEMINSSVSSQQEPSNTPNCHNSSSVSQETYLISSSNNSSISHQESYIITSSNNSSIIQQESFISCGNSLLIEPKESYTMSGNNSSIVRKESCLSCCNNSSVVPQESFISSGDNSSITPEESYVSSSINLSIVPKESYISSGNNSSIVPQESFMTSGNNSLIVPNDSFLSSGNDSSIIPQGSFISSGNNSSIVTQESYVTLSGNNSSFVPLESCTVSTSNKPRILSQQSCTMSSGITSSNNSSIVPCGSYNKSTSSLIKVEEKLKKCNLLEDTKNDICKENLNSDKVLTLSNNLENQVESILTVNSAYDLDECIESVQAKIKSLNCNHKMNYIPTDDKNNICEKKSSVNQLSVNNDARSFSDIDKYHKINKHNVFKDNEVCGEKKSETREEGILSKKIKSDFMFKNNDKIDIDNDKGDSKISNTNCSLKSKDILSVDFSIKSSNISTNYSLKSNNISATNCSLDSCDKPIGVLKKVTGKCDLSEIVKQNENSSLDIKLPNDKSNLTLDKLKDNLVPSNIGGIEVKYNESNRSIKHEECNKTLMPHSIEINSVKCPDFDTFSCSCVSLHPTKKSTHSSIQSSIERENSFIYSDSSTTDNLELDRKFSETCVHDVYHQVYTCYCTACSSSSVHFKSNTTFDDSCKHCRGIDYSEQSTSVSFSGSSNIMKDTECNGPINSETILYGEQSNELLIKTHHYESDKSLTEVNENMSKDVTSNILINSIDKDKIINESLKLFNDTSSEKMIKSHSVGHVSSLHLNVDDYGKLIKDDFRSTLEDMPSAKDYQQELVKETSAEKLVKNFELLMNDYLHNDAERQDSCSPDKAGDSGYPNSSSGRDMEMDLTPEQVKEIMTESESSLENSPPNSPVVGAAAVVIIPPHPPMVHLGDNVENGDVANNNRDGEGNNMIGQGAFVGEPLEYQAVIDHPQEIPLMAFADANSSNDENDEGYHALKHSKKNLFKESTGKKKTSNYDDMKESDDFSRIYDNKSKFRKSKTFMLDGLSSFQSIDSNMMLITDKSITDTSMSCPDSAINLTDDTDGSTSSSYIKEWEGYRMVQSCEIKDLKKYESWLVDRASQNSFDPSHPTLINMENSSLFPSDSLPCCSASLSCETDHSLALSHSISHQLYSDESNTQLINNRRLKSPLVTEDMSVPLSFFDEALDSLIQDIVEELFIPEHEPFADWLLQIQIDSIFGRDELVLDNREDIFDAAPVIDVNIFNAVDSDNSESEHEYIVQPDVKGGGDTSASEP